MFCLTLLVIECRFHNLVYRQTLVVGTAVFIIDEVVYLVGIVLL